MHYPKLFLTFLASMLIYSTTATPLQAYSNNDTYYQGEDFGQNLDLNAVASLFGRSNNLSDFEWRLNDPRNQISNLDLNGDNRVDYLRMTERVQGNMRLIIIQAVAGPDLFQDIAMIEVYRDRHNKTSIQIIGDPYIYGDNYIINPYYAYAPIIYSYFWKSRNYSPYHSRYRWGRYPKHYRTWRPRSAQYYNRHVYRHIDKGNRYNRSRVRKNNHGRKIYRGVRKNDYARKYPNRSYNKKQQRNYRSKSNRSNKTRNRQTTNKQHSSRQKVQRRQGAREQTRGQKTNRQQSYQRNSRRSSTQQRSTQSREGQSTRKQHQSREQRRTKQQKQSTRRHQTRQSIQKQTLQKKEPRKTRIDRRTNSTQQTKTHTRTQSKHSNFRERQ